MHRSAACSIVLGMLLVASRAGYAGDLLTHPLPGAPWGVTPTARITAPESPGVTAPTATAAASQEPSPSTRAVRPTGRLALHTSSWRIDADGQTSSLENEVVTALSYRLTDRPDDGLEFGVDVRHSGFTSGGRPARLSIYEGFVGVRMQDGAVSIRGGHLWLNELGGLGAVAGVAVDAGQRPGGTSRLGRVRAGVFGGLEPRVYEARYGPGVRKYGGFVSLDGPNARRHIAGIVAVHNDRLLERSVLVTTNYVPIGRRVSVYQTAEYDLERPAGQAETGWNYFFTNASVSPADRLDLQATYSRGRSMDVRGLSQDVLAGRPVASRTLEGLRYQSAGGRATVEVFRGARVYAGYSRDTDNRGDAAAQRWLIGAYLTDVAGFDLTASDTITDRVTDGAHVPYVSIGRQLGDRVYLTIDYSTSLVVVRFAREDGFLIETRPQSTRVGGSAVVTLGRSLSLLGTADYTRETEVDDVRVTMGLSYRLR